MITAEQLRKASKRTPDAANMNSVLIALNKYGRKLGLDQPHRETHYLAQLMHESLSFKYDEEIASGKAYENRADLGNIYPGDGEKFKGRTGGQITGRDNYRRFTAWARKLDPNAPDFETHPEKINTDPWEGLGPLWFWSEGNRTKKSLNRYADQNNIEMITKIWNGGLNGYDDRLDYYDRLGLTVLGFGFTKEEYRRFQQFAPTYDGALDGLAGPKTRAAIHAQLVKLTAKSERSDNVAQAPVTVEKPVAVPVPELQKPWYKSPEVLGPIAAPVATAFASFDWRVAIFIIAIVAGFAIYLINRRDRMKRDQQQTVAAIADGALS